MAANVLESVKVDTPARHRSALRPSIHQTEFPMANEPAARKLPRQACTRSSQFCPLRDESAVVASRRGNSTLETGAPLGLEFAGMRRTGFSGEPAKLSYTKITGESGCKDSHEQVCEVRLENLARPRSIWKIECLLG